MSLKFQVKRADLTKLHSECFALQSFLPLEEELQKAACTAPASAPADCKKGSLFSVPAQRLQTLSSTSMPCLPVCGFHTPQVERF